MFSKPFPCGAALPKGRSCDALATIVDIEHIHQQQCAESQFEELLDQIEYTMECPRCGPWKRVETVHMRRTFP